MSGPTAKLPAKPNAKPNTQIAAYGLADLPTLPGKTLTPHTLLHWQFILLFVGLGTLYLFYDPWCLLAAAFLGLAYFIKTETPQAHNLLAAPVITPLNKRLATSKTLLRLLPLLIFALAFGVLGILLKNKFRLFKEKIRRKRCGEDIPADSGENAQAENTDNEINTEQNIQQEERMDSNG